MAARKRGSTGTEAFTGFSGRSWVQGREGVNKGHHGDWTGGGGRQPTSKQMREPGASLRGAASCEPRRSRVLRSKGQPRVSQVHVAGQIPGHGNGTHPGSRLWHTRRRPAGWFRRGRRPSAARPCQHVWWLSRALPHRLLVSRQGPPLFGCAGETARVKDSRRGLCDLVVPCALQLVYDNACGATAHRCHTVTGRRLHGAGSPHEPPPASPAPHAPQ